MRLTTIFMGAFALVSTVSAPSLTSIPASAQEQWTMTSNYPDANFMTQNIRMFLDEVHEGTGGDIEITLHNNQSLYKLAEVLRAVQTGQVELGDIHTGTYGNQDPMFEMDALPFLADDYESALCLWDNQKAYFTEMLEPRSVRILFAQFWPLQGFYANNAVESVSDLEGLKMRVYSPTTRRMAELLGADPVILPFGEIPQGFGTGLINSMFTSPQTGIDVQAWDFVSHYAPVGAMRTKAFVVINENAYQQLSEEHKAVVQEAAERAEERGVEMSDETTQEQLQTLEEQGIVVTEPSQEFLEELRQVGRTMVDEWKADVSEEHQEVLQQFQENC